MRTILKELYVGNIYPDELIISKDPEYHRLTKEISNEMKNWKNKLSADDYKQLETFIDLGHKSSAMDSEASFIYGFKLGSTIMLEVLTEKEELMPEENQDL